MLYMFSCLLAQVSIVYSNSKVKNEHYGKLGRVNKSMVRTFLKQPVSPRSETRMNIPTLTPKTNTIQHYVYSQF